MVGARPLCGAALTAVLCMSGILQVGQAVDMKENDIWWQGVIWDQQPGRLRIFLPGAPHPTSLCPQLDPVILPEIGNPHAILLLR